jgi:DNA-binding NarL/FixJ family response regulator
MSLQILIADDHGVVRKGIFALLQCEKTWSVCDEAVNGSDAVEKAEKYQPDIAIMDITMPEMNGIEATRRILTIAPDTRVLILTMHESELLLNESIKAGARGYILKEDAHIVLIPAIKALAANKSFFSPRIAALAALSRDAAHPQSEAFPSLRHLTPREREIIQLVAEGRKNKDIAKSLHVAIKTVEAHRWRLMQKLGVHSVAELVHYAIRNKLTAS